LISFLFIFYTYVDSTFDPPTQFHKRKKEKERKERFWAIHSLMCYYFSQCDIYNTFLLKAISTKPFELNQYACNKSDFSLLFSPLEVKFKGIRHLVMWNVCINILTATLGLTNISVARVLEHDKINFLSDTWRKFKTEVMIKVVHDINNLG
jgi:hypothetical protein